MQPQQRGDAAEQMITLRKYKRNRWVNRSITAIHVSPSAPGSRGDVWVAHQNPLTLDVYVGCSAEQRDRREDLIKSAVTCFAHDAAGHTWIGHQDGSLKVVCLERGVKGPQQRAALDSPLGSGAALRSMAFDHHGRCLVGDDLGNIHIVQMGANGLQVQGNQTTMVEANVRRPAVQAIATHGQYVFSTGGVIDSQHPHAIRVWDTHARVQDTHVGLPPTRLVEVPCTYGAVTSLAVWQPYASGSAGGQLGPGMTWLLLSGHEGGQVVMWRLQHDSTGRAALVREAGPFGVANKGTSVLNMFVFPERAMLVTAYSSSSKTLVPGHQGTLTAWMLPAPTDLPKSKFLPCKVFGAHEKPMVAASCLGGQLVTASRVTVRMWTPGYLAQACRQELDFSERELPLPPVASVPLQAVSTAQPIPSAAQQATQHVAASSLGSSTASGSYRAEQLQQAGLSAAASSSQAAAQSLQARQSELRSMLAANQQQKPQQGGISSSSSAAKASSSSKGNAAVQYFQIPEASKAPRKDGSDLPSAEKVAALAAAHAARGPVAYAAAAGVVAPISDAIFNPIKPAAQTSSSSGSGPAEYEPGAKPGILKEFEPGAKPGKAALQEPPNKPKSLPMPAPVPPAARTADLSAELSAHCRYRLVKLLPAPHMFGPVRALQVSCNYTNRLRTMLQLPRTELQKVQQAGPQGWSLLHQELQLAGELHHPHLLQLQEIFLGPAHLEMVLEECSAGRLVDFPAKHSAQSAAWTRLEAATAGPAALSADFARWFFQQLVLGVDFYHQKVAQDCEQQQRSPPGVSSLSIRDAVLKVAPNLPQPVVKVPTRLLSQGPAAAAAPLKLISSSCWDPPETLAAAKLATSTAARLAALQAADVWACGVMLVTLLGGTITSKDAPHADFQLPQKLIAEGPDTLHGLLTQLLAFAPQQRMPLRKVLQHPWFATGLPAAAKDMTERFLSKPRACKQPVEEIKVVLDAAAAGSLPSLQKLLPLLQAAPKAAQQQQEQPVAALPARQELLYCLQLQSNALRQAYAQLLSTTQALQHSRSSIAVAQELSTQLALRYTANSIECMARALAAMTDYERLQKQKQPLRGRWQLSNLNTALLLQQACSEALFSLSKLDDLLQPVQETATGQQQQQKPQTAALPQQLVMDDAQQHACLFDQAHLSLTALWRCSKAADAVVVACCRAAMPKAAKKVRPLRLQQPEVLRAALGVARLAHQIAGPAAEACVVRLYQQQLPGKQSQQQQQQQQQDQQQRLFTYDCVEGMGKLLVQLDDPPAGQKSPSSSSSSFGDGFILRGLLQQPGEHRQVQQQYEEVQVACLEPLFAPSKGTGRSEQPAIPEQRRKAREQQERKAVRSLAPSWLALCPICHNAMENAVMSGRNSYCESCLVKHISTSAVSSTTYRDFKSNQEVPKPQALTPNLDVRRTVDGWIAQELPKYRQKQQQKREEELQQVAGAFGGSWEYAGQHDGLANAAEASSKAALEDVREVLLQLRDKGHLSSSSTRAAAAAASSTQLAPPFVPVYSLCSSPPMMVLPKAAGGTLQEWISSRAKSLSRQGGTGAPTTGASSSGDLAVAWQSGLPWGNVLQVLQDVAAALMVLHQQQPATVHGSIHAGAVHLLQELGDGQQGAQQQQQGGRLAQLSLAALLKKLAPISSCHPFLAAPEIILATGSPTPAADVYGFGVLMFQLASGWLPQQYLPGTDDQISAVVWCREMLDRYGSTSPTAAAEARQRGQLNEQAAAAAGPLTRHSGNWSPYDGHLLVKDVQQGCEQDKLLQAYYDLMTQCLIKVPPARPCMAQVVAQLQLISSSTSSSSSGSGSGNFQVCASAPRPVDTAANIFQLAADAAAGKSPPTVDVTQGRPKADLV